MSPKNILIAEDEHALAAALGMAVRRSGHIPLLAATGTAALDAARREPPAAAVLDIGLPDMSGLELLRRLRRNCPALPVLVITAHGSLDNAIEAQKLGASQYLVKPLDLRQFSQALESLVASAETPKPRPAAPASGGPLIGGAAAMQEVFIGIARACAGAMPVLISGPGGAGKSLAARIIHERSGAAGPFREIHPQDIPDPAALRALLETPGHLPPLVLNDISSLPPAIQSALAAHLSGPGTGPRIIAICQGDPHQAMLAGSLRQDLYYPLSPLEIRLPPLSERSSDIPALAAWFLASRAGERPPPGVTPAALNALQAYAWPGQVRELRHVLDYAATICQGAPILPAHLPPHVSACGGAAAPSELATAVSRWIDAELESAPVYDALLDRVETLMLRHLLARHDQKPTRLAAAMEMNRATLRQKLRRLGLSQEESD